MLAVLTAAVMTSLHIRSSPRLRVAAVPAMSAQEDLDLATVTADLEAALERARRLLRADAEAFDPASAFEELEKRSASRLDLALDDSAPAPPAAPAATADKVSVLAAELVNELSAAESRQSDVLAQRDAARQDAERAEAELSREEKARAAAELAAARAEELRTAAEELRAAAEAAIASAETKLQDEMALRRAAEENVAAAEARLASGVAELEEGQADAAETVGSLSDDLERAQSALARTQAELKEAGARAAEALRVRDAALVRQLVASAVHPV
jgi:hypothetical protein